MPARAIEVGRPGPTSMVVILRRVARAQHIEVPAKPDTSMARLGVTSRPPADAEEYKRFHRRLLERTVRDQNKLKLAGMSTPEDGTVAILKPKPPTMAGSAVWPLQI